MSQTTFFQSDKTQPIQTITNLFKELVMAYRLCPKLSQSEKEMLKQKILEIDEIDSNLVQAFLDLDS